MAFRPAGGPAAPRLPSRAPPPPRGLFDGIFGGSQEVSAPGRGRLSGPSSGAVLVVGATGRVGRRVVSELALLGVPVVAGVRAPDEEEDPEGHANALDSKLDALRELVATDAANDEMGAVSPALAKRAPSLVSVARFDLEDPSSWPTALGQCRRVVIAAAYSGPATNLAGWGRVDGRLTTDFVRFLRDLPEPGSAGGRGGGGPTAPEHVTLVSSLGVATPLKPPYLFFNLLGGLLFAKADTEKTLRASNLPFLIVRPGGMERPTDDHGSTHAPVVAGSGEVDALLGDKGADAVEAVVSCRQVAKLTAAAARAPGTVGGGKIIEIVSRPAPGGDTDVDWAALVDSAPAAAGTVPLLEMATRRAARGETIAALAQVAVEADAAAMRVAVARSELDEARAAAADAADAAREAAREADAARSGDEKATAARAKADELRAMRDKLIGREEAAGILLAEVEAAAQEGRLLDITTKKSIIADVTSGKRAARLAREAEAEAKRKAAAQAAAEREAAREAARAEAAAAVVAQRKPATRGRGRAAPVEADAEENKAPAKRAAPAPLFAGLFAKAPAPYSEKEEEEEEVEEVVGAPAKRAAPASIFSGLFGGGADKQSSQELLAEAAAEAEAEAEDAPALSRSGGSRRIVRRGQRTSDKTVASAPAAAVPAKAAPPTAATSPRKGDGGIFGGLSRMVMPASPELSEMDTEAEEDEATRVDEAAAARAELEATRSALKRKAAEGLRAKGLEAKAEAGREARAKLAERAPTAAKRDEPKAERDEPEPPTPPPKASGGIFGALRSMAMPDTVQEEGVSEAANAAREAERAAQESARAEAAAAAERKREAAAAAVKKAAEERAVAQAAKNKAAARAERDASDQEEKKQRIQEKEAADAAAAAALAPTSVAPPATKAAEPSTKKPPANDLFAGLKAMIPSVGMSFAASMDGDGPEADGGTAADPSPKRLTADEAADAAVAEVYAERRAKAEAAKAVAPAPPAASAAPAKAAAPAPPVAATVPARDPVSEYGLPMPTNRVEPIVSTASADENRKSASAWVSAWRGASSGAAAAVAAPASAASVPVGGADLSEYGLTMPTNRVAPIISEASANENRASAQSWIEAWRAGGGGGGGSSSSPVEAKDGPSDDSPALFSKADVLF